MALTLLASLASLLANFCRTLVSSIDLLANVIKMTIDEVYPVSFTVQFR